MGKTRRHEPKRGEFKKLKASNKKQRNKKQRQTKADLTRHVKFASKHREHLNMTQMSAAMYMEEENE